MWSHIHNRKWTTGDWYRWIQLILVQPACWQLWYKFTLWKGRRSDFWTGLEPNCTVLDILIQIPCWLPRPVGNTAWMYIVQQPGIAPISAIRNVLSACLGVFWGVSWNLTSEQKSSRHISTIYCYFWKYLTVVGPEFQGCQIPVLTELIHWPSGATGTYKVTARYAGECWRILCKDKNGWMTASGALGSTSDTPGRSQDNTGSADNKALKHQQQLWHYPELQQGSLEWQHLLWECCCCAWKW